MGQYWQVINLDKRQTMGFWGKLGECLFDGSPGRLIHPLKKLTSAEQEEQNKVRDFFGWDDYDSKIDIGGAWIGDRIICLGDYHVDSKLPKIPPHESDLLTKEEAQELRDARDEDENANLYTFAQENYQEVQFPSKWYRGSNSVLRNLTTREYMRNALVPRSEYGNFERIGLGEVLLARISWSPTEDNSGDTSMSYSGGIHRGVWAGHRFDIITLEEMEGLDEAAEWKDVSEDVAREIDAIWTSEYEEEWVEAVHKVRPSFLLNSGRRC